MRSFKINLFYVLLFTPVLAYIYTVVLGLPKTIIHLYVFVTFIFGIFFLLDIRKISVPKYVWFLIIYAIYRLIWLQVADLQYHFLTKIYYSILYFSIAFIIIIIYNTSFSTKFISNTITIIKITVIATLIVSIIQVFNYDFLNPWDYFGFEDIMEANIYSQRRTSIYGFINPNALGLSFVPLLSVLIGYMLIRKNRYNIIFILFGAVVAFLSNTRYIMVAVLILTLQYLYYFKVKIFAAVRFSFVIFIMGFVIYFTLNNLGYNLEQYSETRLFAEGSITETTRYKAINNFLYFFPQNPLFGTGKHITEEIREASREIGSSQIHVGYLAHLVSYGIIGSIFLFAFWFGMALSLYRNAKKTRYWGAFFAFLVFLWAQATLVYYPIYFTGILFALIFDKYFMDINNQQKLKMLTR